MNDRATHYDDDPLKSHGQTYKVSLKTLRILGIILLIVLIVLAAPLAWYQTYGSPG